MKGAIIPSDISTSEFAPIDSVMNSTARQAIVRPDNPPPGIAGFLFDIPEDEAIRLQSAITDHYIEGNSAIADHIALAPEQFTVRGLVAEIVSLQPTSDEVERIANSLPVDENLAPELTPGAQQQIDEANAQAAADEAKVTDAKSLYGYFDARAPQPPQQTRQSKAFRFFFELWRGRQLVSIATPWGFLTDMAILSLAVEQGADTKFISAISITFKKIRIAQSVTVSAGQLAGRLFQQMAPVTQNGTAAQAPATDHQKESVLQRIFGAPLP